MRYLLVMKEVSKCKRELVQCVLVEYVLYYISEISQYFYLVFYYFFVNPDFCFSLVDFVND